MSRALLTTLPRCPRPAAPAGSGRPPVGGPAAQATPAEGAGEVDLERPELDNPELVLGYLRALASNALAALACGRLDQAVGWLVKLDATLARRRLRNGAQAGARYGRRRIAPAWVASHQGRRGSE